MLGNYNQKENIDKIKRELSILYEVSNLMRTTLDLNQIFYIILTALTSHEGLAFNRAMLFLVNKEGNLLEGVMGIGPHSGEEADRIWRGIEKENMTMTDIVASYDRFRKDPESKLNTVVKGIKIPLTEDMGILALTILEGMPFEITTDVARKKANPDIANKLKTEYFVTIPLKSKNTVVGAILVDNLFTKKPITKSDVRLLTMLANHAGLAIENSRLYEKSVILSKTDWLTQLWNSGEFHKKLSLSIEKAKINDAPLSLAMLDMDNFKMYNDTHGHLKGDEALRDTAKILNERSRRGDIACRYGGEEFAIIMPFTDGEDAIMIAERLRKEIETFFIEKKGIKAATRLTASIGVASFPQHANDKDSLINRSDSALYESKRLGKNKTCLYRSDIKKFFQKFGKLGGENQHS